MVLNLLKVPQDSKLVNSGLFGVKRWFFAATVLWVATTANVTPGAAASPGTRLEAQQVGSAVIPHKPILAVLSPPSGSVWVDIHFFVPRDTRSTDERATWSLSRSSLLYYEENGRLQEIPHPRDEEASAMLITSSDAGVTTYPVRRASAFPESRGGSVTGWADSVPIGPGGFELGFRLDRELPSEFYLLLRDLPPAVGSNGCARTALYHVRRHVAPAREN